MIDTVSVLVFSLLIVYAAYRAITLDKQTPWFWGEKEKQGLPGAGKVKRK